MRDIWLNDDEPGCLECGDLHFKASYVAGVCYNCMTIITPADSFSARYSEENHEGYSSYDTEDSAEWVES